MAEEVVEEDFGGLLVVEEPQNPHVLAQYSLASEKCSLFQEQMSDDVAHDEQSACLPYVNSAAAPPTSLH